jgi:PAS domain-containing protein
MDVFKDILLFIGGGGLAAIVNLYLAKRKEGREDFSAIIQLWRDDNQRLRDLETALKIKIDHLEDMLNEFKVKLVLLETAHMELPIPMWIKDRDGTMLSLNRAYESAFLIPRGKISSDYIGKKDEELWSKEEAETFKVNDLLAHKEIVFLTETIKIKDQTIDLYVIRYPRKVGGEIVGIGGIAINKTHIK